MSQLIKWKPGLTVAMCDMNTPSQYLRTVLEKEFRSGKSKTGIDLHKKLPVLAIHCGATAYSEALQLEAYWKENKTHKPIETRQISERSDFDWSANEGYEHVVQFITDQQISDDEELPVVTFHQTFATGLPLHAAEGFNRIHREAKRRKRSILIVVSTTRPDEGTVLKDLVNIVFKVKVADPDPGAITAFSIACLGLEPSHPLGVGMVLANIYVNDNEKLYARLERYISGDASSRAIFYLRNAGKTYKEIGDLLGMNKSTVLRRANQLPQHWKPTTYPQWVLKMGEDLTRTK